MRARKQKRPKATPESPPTGSGGVSDSPPPPLDMAQITEEAVAEGVRALMGHWEGRKHESLTLMGKAVKERFPTPPAVAHAVMVASTRSLADPDPRFRLIAAKTIVAASAQNQDDDHHADNQKLANKGIDAVIKLWSQDMPMDGV